MADGKNVTLTLTREDYDQLLVILGYAAGAASREDKRLFYSIIKFTNELNAWNPHFRPYAIPAEGEEGG